MLYQSTVCVYVDDLYHLGVLCLYWSQVNQFFISTTIPPFLALQRRKLKGYRLLQTMPRNRNPFIWDSGMCFEAEFGGLHTLQLAHTHNITSIHSMLTLPLSPSPVAHTWLLWLLHYHWYSLFPISQSNPEKNITHSSLDSFMACLLYLYRVMSDVCCSYQPMCFVDRDYV